jgi:hypothetical protein
MMPAACCGGTIVFCQLPKKMATKSVAIFVSPLIARELRKRRVAQCRAHWAGKSGPWAPSSNESVGHRAFQLNDPQTLTEAFWDAKQKTPSLREALKKALISTVVENRESLIVGIIQYLRSTTSNSSA